MPGTHKTAQWALNAARAIENSVYVAGVCQAPPVSVGRSVPVDPMRIVEADLGLEPGLWTVEVSLEQLIVQLAGFQPGGFAPRPGGMSSLTVWLLPFGAKVTRG